MARAQAADFLVEIGTEELPPKALKDLMQAFASGVGEALARERLDHAAISAYASPRRLALIVRELACAQEDREQELRGPPVAVAFDDAGNATAAARAFAGKCGVPVEALGRIRTGKGEWVSCRSVEAGRPAVDLLPALVQGALEQLPIPRRMRWGSNESEFVRPVHWVLMLHGNRLVDGNVLGIRSGRSSRGHRFMAPGELVVNEPGDYAALLENEGCVLADYYERLRRITAGVEAAAADAGGRPLATDALYEEVAALTEWPVALTGHFDPRYLELPREVIAATLTRHQRCFPLADAEGNLLPQFVVVANLASRHPEQVRQGNERVIRPRLADAAFFWEQDRQKPLAEHCAGLEDVVFQEGLGSLADKCVRVGRLAASMAREIGADAALLEHAARLAKCDLLSGMVGEFPELQGLMGAYYARGSGESEAVAQAIGEQYLPRFAGDRLPETVYGQLLALADRLDSLAGAFALGRKPTGNRDPFGLRRAGLGVVRIAIEKELHLDLPALLATAVAEQPVPATDPAGIAAGLYDFLTERLRSYYSEQGIAPEVFEAVRVRRPASLPDFNERLAAVASFVELEPAASLSAADKRIANILRQAGTEEHGAVDESLLTEAAEENLYMALRAANADIGPLLERRSYGAALERLAELRGPVDRFFDDVMVMTDEAAVKRNRLALLAELRAMFLGVADISRLSIG